MSTIAEKLEYLDGTREKILTETNRLGVGLTEQDKFRDYAKGLHDGYVDILNNGTDTLYDNMEKVSGSGSEITLENTEEAPMRSDLEGDISQETTTGKNLIPTPDKTETTINGLTYSISNGVLTINGTATANTTISIATELNIDIPDRTQYRISVNKEGITTATGSNLQYLLRNSSNSILGYANNIASNTQAINTFQSNGTINNIIFVVVSGVSLTNATFTFQVEKSSTATAYEEYTGGQPSPNPDYPREIEVVSGRQEVDIVGGNNNLFDISTITENNYLNTNGTTGASSVTNISDYIGIEANNKYVLSYDYQELLNTNDRAVCYYNENKEFISGHNYSAINKKNTFTTPNNAKYLRFAYDKNCTNIYFLKVYGYEINLGKNLLKNTNVNSGDNNYWASYSTYDEETGTLTRSTTATTESTIQHRINLKNNTQYTISCLAKSNGYVSSLDLYAYNSTVSKIYSKTTLALTTEYQKYSFTFTTDSTTNFTNAVIRFDNNGSTQSGTEAILTITDVMLVEGTDTEFAPYKTPIELCKINTYKDRIYKDNGTWYLHKEIGKVVLNGSESWNYNSTTNSFVIYKPISDIKDKEQYSSQTIIPPVLMNYYKGQTWQNFLNGAIGFTLYYANNTLQLRLSSTLTTASDFKTWLSTHNTIVYYVLETPTTEEITDTELISQLEEWYNQKSNKDTTYISVTSEDLPAILNVIAIKKYE